MVMNSNDEVVLRWEGMDRTRDAVIIVQVTIKLSSCPSPMLDIPATATAGNGVNGDNECRRQRSIYTAFEKARATHVCFPFVGRGGVSSGLTYFNKLSRQLRLRLQYAKLKVEHGW